MAAQHESALSRLISAGLATQAVPLYLSEIAPVQIRGMLNIMFQLSITIGILIAQVINFGTRQPVNDPLVTEFSRPYVEGKGWRIALTNSLSRNAFSQTSMPSCCAKYPLRMPLRADYACHAQLWRT